MSLFQTIMDDPELKVAHAKMAASTAVGGGGFAYTLNDWVAIATLLFLGLQIGLLVPKYLILFKEWRRDRKKTKS